MKIEKILLLSFTVILLVQCKKKSDEPYPDEYILMDNAKAAVYFHTVFREAENAWAFIDSMKYKSGAYSDPASIPTKYKNFTYDEETNTVTIEYNAWVSEESFPDLLLIGKMYVKFEKNVYRIVNGSVANVTLNGFSINGQMVAGESKITYQTVANNKDDHYSYVVLDGAAIYEKGNSTKILISCAIRDGRYVRYARIEEEDGDGEGDGEEDGDGKEYDAKTAMQDDDTWTYTWTYTGTMSGKVGEDQSLTYTNSILATYPDENGKTQDGSVLFKANCEFAEKGDGQIKIPGRPDIRYRYFQCSDVQYVTVTHVD